jgi:hypothetical protein
MLTVPSQQASTSRFIRDDSTDGAVAGPSGISTRQLVSSTPNIQLAGTHLLTGAEQKMNGMKILCDFKGEIAQLV